MSRPPFAVRSWGVRKDGRIVSSHETQKQAEKVARTTGGEVCEGHFFALELGDGFHAPLSDKILWEKKP